MMCIHDFDVNDLIMPCVVIDILDKCHKRYSLSAQDVANLNSMPATGSFVMVLPIKIKDGTEASVRLVGLIERDVVL